MELWQAILIAALYWLDAGEIYVPFTYCFIDLMFVSMLTGLILGDITTGVIVGGTIQPLYLALTAVGGSVPVDKVAAGIITTSMVITQGISLEEGLVISSVAALLFAQLHTVKRVAMLWTVHHADKCVEVGNIRGLYLTSFIGAAGIRALIFLIPMTIILAFGIDSLGSLINGMPSWGQNIFNVAGGMMPALGFAMTIMVIGKGTLIPFFLCGFFFEKYTAMGSISGAMLGLFLAWLYLTFTKQKDERGGIFGDLSALAKRESSKDFWEGRLLSKKTVNKAWFNWRMHICHVDNVERLQALGMCLTMEPVLKELYPDDREAYIDGLKRHMQFFITENMVGGIIPGIAVSMEEERAKQIRAGVDPEHLISGELINSVKTGMMGPFAGIGDTLNYSTIKPLMCAFFMTFAQQGHIWAPIVYDVLLYIILVSEGHFLYNLGYKLGTKSATAILKNNAIQKVITFFSILGLFVMGIMAAQNVNVSLGIMIPKATESVSLQIMFLDAIAPGLLSIVAVFGLYAYMKKGGTILKATIILIGIAIVLGGLGILGG